MRTSRIYFVVTALCICAAIVICLLLGATAAKRKRAAQVPPVRIGNIEYRVPNKFSSEGVVEAWDLDSGHFLWSKKVYPTFKLPFVEGDTQWVFIKTLEVGPDPGTLIVVNEEGRRYEIDTRPPYSWMKAWASTVAFILSIGILLAVLVVKLKRLRQS